MLRRFRRAKTLCALDIGTTKVCALIGHINEEGRLNVSGVGTCRSRGLIRGDVVDINHTVEAILKAVAQAEELAKVSPREVIIGIAGDHIQSFNVEASVVVPHPERGIDERDRDRAIRKARDMLIAPAKKEIIHWVVQSYLINGKCDVLNPIGLSSDSVGVRMHLILASALASQNILRCVNRAALRARDVVLQSLASSLSVFSEHEKELGALLLDIGGGTTDLAIFRHGSIYATAEIPLGGNVITNDIQSIWKLSFHDAENLKKKCGTTLPMSVDGDEMVDLPSLHPARGVERRRRRELAAIIEARAEEILLLARDKVEREIPLEELRGGIVLTGGSAMLCGIDQVAERVFGNKKCRVGYPQGIVGMSGVLSSPIYSTAVGLLNFGLEDDPGKQPSPRPDGPWRRFWGRWGNAT